MGIEIDRIEFEERDHAAFAQRLGRSLEALEQLLSTPGFGVGERSIGAELEVSLIDGDARPLPINEAVLGETLDPRITVELNRFNLECNLAHTGLAGRPFDALEHEFGDALREVRRAARIHRARVVTVGILPTLEETDLQRGAMTETPRFVALSRALRGRRQEPFHVQIDGPEPLSIHCDSVTFEGAATSLQIHLRVDPEHFASMFNAAQLATAPVLAVAGNSPSFLGHQLWEETRVALFKQAVDIRSGRARRDRQAARVSFGSGWVQDGALELFQEAVDQHEVLLPVLGSEDPLECLQAGGLPPLDEVRLHQGTVWHWNRPVYDPASGGHLRIEMRALPAGPSIPDMLANMAFQVGLTLALAEEMPALQEDLDFEDAHANFYRAAQHGLESRLRWPGVGRGDTVSARELIPRLIPLAERGLVAAGIEPGEAASRLGIIEARCASGQTGAVWQRACVEKIAAQSGAEGAFARMLERYLEHSEAGDAVHLWSIGS
jgi:hypothetical protein